MKKLQSISIGKKITLGIAIFIFPIVLLGYFLIDEKEGLINFTKQEIVGVNYLRSAHEVLSIVTSPSAKENLGKAVDILKKAEAEDAGKLSVTQKSQDLIAALQTTPPLDNETLATKTIDLISTISDNSNITLDPDSDAYFIGDIIVNQSTAVLAGINSLVIDNENLQKDASNNENIIAYSKAIDAVLVNADDIQIDLAKAIKANDAIQTNLGSDGKTLKESSDRLLAIAKSENKNGLGSSASELSLLLKNFVVKNNDEMERLLNNRIYGFDEVLITRLGIVSAAVIVGGLIFFLIINSITKPISIVIKQMERLTWGELDIVIPKTDRKDEIGKLIASLSAFHMAAIEKDKTDKLELKRSEEEKKRAQLIQKITSDFESKVQGIVSSVASASTELAHTAEEVTKMMQQTSNSAKTAAQNSSETASKVKSVASSAEQMSFAVKEISSQVQRTNQLANDSRQKTDAADEKASVLSIAAQKVSEAVTMIASISGQINLLALNATIESARAGEAGKGFAVVASEVKNLATQTNKSVEEVSKVIEEVNAASASIIEALNSIKESVDNVSDASSTIAAAVEEQSATTTEITNNMQSAAQGTQIISSNLDSVSESSSQASAAAAQVLSAAKELSIQSEDLNKEVGEFLHKIRNA